MKCRSCGCELSDLDEQIEICSEASLGDLCWIYFQMWIWRNREARTKEMYKHYRRKILQSDEFMGMWRALLDDWLSHVRFKTESRGVEETFEYATKLAWFNAPARD